MKKTATMTWLHNNNYGTVLQAYALQKAIVSLGYYNEVIDYKPRRITKAINLVTSGNSFKLFYYKAIAFKASIVAKIKRNKKSKFVTSEKTSANARSKMESFVNSNIHTTRTIRTPGELKKLRGKYDAYICGSDQIWNPDYLNPPYFLHFLAPEDKRIAYSPSFGVKSIAKKKQKIIHEYVSQFQSISVREEEGVSILNEIGIETSRTEVTLDPTMLLKPNEWEELCCNIELQVKGPYLLCYFLHSNPLYWSQVEKIAKTQQLQIVVIPVTEESYKLPFCQVIASPEEWVSLVKGASFILTDSFHCMLFSVMFHKNFYAYKRFDDDNIQSQNSRIENFLKRVGLSSRLRGKREEIGECTTITSFDEVDHFLELERAKSLDYLARAIG